MKSPVAWLSCGALLLAGCSSLSVRSQSPEDESHTKLVSDLAAPFGMFPVRVEGIGLVGGLNGTGSDSAPSPERAALIDDMQARGVSQPNAVLSSRNCALVKVQGFLRPGIQKGDRFDLEVRVTGRSETSSLRGGWLMETRMQEMALLGGSFHKGNLLALGEGAVMIDPAAEGKKDTVMLCRGRVLGGGEARKSRDLGLVLKPDHQNVFNASRVANAVNKRFYTFDKGLQTGVAKAKTDKFIALAIHPHYKDNIARYMRVVRAIAVQEGDTQRSERIARLQKELLDPETAGDAALQLEAIGKQGADALLAALQSKNTEVRFYAAEALAYLDYREAAEPLAEIARNEPAFRVFALTALSAIGDYAAYEQLRGMLDLASAETRYGAFRALWTMNARDPLVLGERLGERSGDQFSYHALDSVGPPLVHITHNRRAELVLFGKEQRLVAPLALNAGNQIMVTANGPDEVAVSKYTVNEPDQKRLVSTRLDDVVRAIVELGGRYPDVVQALQEAKLSGALPSRLEVDAVPESGRNFRRQSADAGKPAEVKPGTPVPELFSKRGGKAAADDADTEDEQHDNGKKRPLRGFFARMMGRDAG
jgi:flagellar basal body P-ring protein FlgI